MTKDQARTAIVSEWLSLDPRLRDTQKQLAMFAKAATERYRFPHESDRTRAIEEWLAAARMLEHAQG